jgi:deoxyguanosine kinase
MDPIVLSIEGNIGSGKSTMLRTIRETFLEWNIIDEPVDHWMALKDENGKSLLECFYEDKNRWSYTFQNAAFITRYTNIQNALNEYKANPQNYKSNIFITERCLMTDRYVFAEMLRDSKCLSPLEWELYTRWFDIFSKNSPVHGLIYVNTPYTICSERIKKRDRKGEHSIPLEYLESLENQHINWLSNTKLEMLEIKSDKSELNKVKEWSTKF